MGEGKIRIQEIAKKIAIDYEVQAGNINKTVFLKQMKDFIKMRDLFPIVRVQMINDDYETEDYAITGRYLKVINWLDKNMDDGKLQAWNIEEVLTDKIFARKIADKWV